MTIVLAGVDDTHGHAFAFHVVDREIDELGRDTVSLGAREVLKVSVALAIDPQSRRLCIHTQDSVQLPNVVIRMTEVFDE